MSEREANMERKRENETDTDGVLGFPCAPPALFTALKVKCSWKQNEVMRRHGSGVDIEKKP